MKGKNGLLKRWIAVALSAAMVFNLCPNGLTLLTASASSAVSTTTGQLMADAYSLTSAEEAVLTSGYLNESTYTYVAPSDGDDLVLAEDGTETNNTVEVTITAKTYTDTQGNTWTPGSAATVTYDNSQTQPKSVTLTSDGNGNYVGTFTNSQDDKNYSVSVDYSIATVAGAAEQQRLFESIGWLYTGVENLDTVYSELYSSLKALESVIDDLYNFKSYMATSSNYIESLYTQYSTNGSFDLTKDLESYTNGNSTEYLLTGDFKTDMEETYEYLVAISADISSWITIFDNNPNLEISYNGKDLGSTIIEAKLFNPTLQSALTAVVNICDADENYKVDANQVVTYDAWACLTENSSSALLITTIDTAGYTALDNLLTALGTYTASSVTYADLSIAPSVTINAQVNRHSVDVEVTAAVIDLDSTDCAADNTATTTKTYTDAVSVSDGADQSAVETAAADAESAALAEWTDYDVDTANYERTVNVEKNSGEITKIVIAYTPKDVTLTTEWDSASTSVPYGYVYTLADHATTGWLYKYTVTVNVTENFYWQCSTVRFTAATSIVRAEVEGSVEDTWLYTLTAAATDSGFSDEAAAILGSSALHTETSGNSANTAVELLYPTDVELKVDNSGFYVVSAPSVSAYLSGGSVTGDAYWVADTYTAYDNSQAVVDTGSFNGAETATLTVSSGVAYVKVTYKLSISSAIIDSDDLLAALNLPAALVEEYSAQKAVLDSLSDADGDLMKGLEAFGDYLGDIRIFIGNFDTSARNVINSLYNEYGANGSLGLYSSLSSYQSSGMAWYYSGDNAENLIEEIAEMYSDIKTVVDDTYCGGVPEYTGQTTLEYILNSLVSSGRLTQTQVDNYMSRIDAMISTLEAVTLQAPNAAINTSASSADLAALAAALEAGATAGVSNETFTGISGNMALTTEVSKEAPGMAMVTVQIVNDAGTVLATADPVTFDCGSGTSYTLTAADITSLGTELSKLESTLTYPYDNYYYRSGSLGLSEGDTIDAGSTAVSVTWSAKTYNVTFAGDVDASWTDQTITYEDAAVTIPVPAEGTKYEVTLKDGSSFTVTADGSSAYSYTGLASCFDSTGAINDLLTVTNPQSGDASIILTVTTVDIAHETMISLVDELNAALAGVSGVSTSEGMAVSFIPVEDADGNVTDIVLRMSPQSGMSYTEIIAAVAEVLLASSNISSEVTLKGKTSANAETFVDVSDTTVYFQALVDAVLNSGFTMDDLLKATEVNGDYMANELTLSGTVASFTNNTLGGSYYVSNAETGTQSNFYGAEILSLVTGIDGCNVTLHITLENFGKPTAASSLDSLHSALAKMSSYVDFKMTGGTADVDLTLPDSAYQMLLADLLLTGELELSDINAVDNDALVNEVWALIEEALAADLNGSSISEVTKNTLNQLGITSFDTYFDNSSFTGILNLLWTAAGNCTYDGSTLTYNGAALETFVNNMSSLASGILSDNEKTNGLTAALDIDVANISSTSYEALILDTSASGLTQMIGFKKNLSSAITAAGSGTIVVLTGDYTGNISTDKALYLDLNGHTIDGSVTGTNITVIDSSLGDSGVITGGLNGSAYAGNTLYSVTSDGSGGISVYLNPDELLDNNFSAQEIAVTLAFDLLLNNYMSASMSMGGYAIYEVELDDLLGMLADHCNGNTSLSTLANDILSVCVTLGDDSTGISGLLTQMLTEFTDFSTLYSSASAGSALASYAVNTAYWGLTVTTADDNGTYLTVDAAADSNNTAAQKTISIYLDSTSTHYSEVITLLENLSGVAEVSDQSIVIKDVSLSSGRQLDIAGSVDMNATLTLNEDDDYALIVAILLANITDGTTQSDLITAINAFDLNATSTTRRTLKKAVNACSVSDLVAALKAVNAGTDLEAVINNLTSSAGLSITNTTAKDLYAKYEILFVGISYILRNTSVAGVNTALSNYEDTANDNEGTYVLNAAQAMSGSVGASGMTVNYTLNAQSANTSKITVALFGATYSVIATDSSGTIHKGDTLDVLDNITGSDVETIEINDNVDMDRNIEVSNEVDLVFASNVAFANVTGSFCLMSSTAKLVSNVSLSNVTSASDEMKVDASDKDANGNYTYSLSYYDVVVYDSSNGVITDGTGNNLGYAIQSAITNDGSVTVYGSVAMGADINVTDDVSLTISESNGGQIKDMGTYSFVLTSGKTLSSNVSLSNVTSALDEMDVVEYVPDASGIYTYTLSYYDVVAYDSSGKVIKDDDPDKDPRGDFDKAVIAAKNNNGSVTVYGSVAMSGIIDVDRDLTINVNTSTAGAISAGSYYFRLTAAGVTLTSNQQLAVEAYSGVTGASVTETYNSSTGLYSYTLTVADPNYDGLLATPPSSSTSTIQKVKVETGYIYLDVHPDGITAEQFKSAILHRANNADTSVLTSIDTKNGLVYTGAKATWTATNTSTGKTATITYTVIIMGDTNCDGASDSGDATQMQMNYLGTRVLTGNSLLAGDINWDGSVDSGDATRTKYKWLNWSSYVSSMK
ncbi:MAG: dockerin type I repeat-containing protein [Clostridiales bacterium]|nr:dockerin type I repeat-containing protein [Clostridiales bacterium]